jgi:predicted Fe-Mo cluster-binding NifX family protein
MKVAIPCNKDKVLVPLDQAEVIVLYNDEDKSISESENAGYGSKEATMSMILNEAPDVIAVKEGIMCPGSYMMSQGSIKYALVKSDSANDIIANKEYEGAKEELAEEIFAEND